MLRVSAHGQQPIEDDCFAYGTDTEPEPVTIGGFDGLSVEPYRDPDVLFFNVGTRTGETTGAYALAIGDRTLCVYLSWDPDTTQEELESARQVVESIRGQPIGSDGDRWTLDGISRAWSPSGRSLCEASLPTSRFRIRAALRMRANVAAIAIALPTIGCATDGTDASVSAAPQSDPPSASMTSMRATPSSSASGAALDWFPPTVAGFALTDAPEAVEGFESAANASLGEIGVADVQAAATAAREGESVTVVAFALRPTEFASEQEMFVTVLESMASGFGVAPMQGVAGQAYVMEGTDTVAIIGPWATGPYTVFLFATGTSRGPTEELYRFLLEAGPGG